MSISVNESMYVFMPYILQQNIEPSPHAPEGDGWCGALARGVFCFHFVLSVCVCQKIFPQSPLSPSFILLSPRNYSQHIFGISLLQVVVLNLLHIIRIYLAYIWHILSISLAYILYRLSDKFQIFSPTVPKTAEIWHFEKSKIGAMVLKWVILMYLVVFNLNFEFFHVAIQTDVV